MIYWIEGDGYSDYQTKFYFHNHYFYVALNLHFHSLNSARLLNNYSLHLLVNLICLGVFLSKFDLMKFHSFYRCLILHPMLLSWTKVVVILTNQLNLYLRNLQLFFEDIFIPSACFFRIFQKIFPLISIIILIFSLFHFFY